MILVMSVAIETMMFQGTFLHSFCDFQSFWDDLTL